MKSFSIQQIVSDTELDSVWGNANFGACSRRELIHDSLLKCLGGYAVGHTAKCILQELSLVYANKWRLTKKGERYLYLSIVNVLAVS